MFIVSGLQRVRTELIGLFGGRGWVPLFLLGAFLVEAGALAEDAPRALELRAPMKPQVTVGLTIGGGAHELRTSAQGAFRLGAYSDVLFFRRRGGDMAFGPYAEVLTTNLSSIQVGGGVAWLIPIIADELPFVLSGGVTARKGPEGWGPMATARVFWGSRSFNFHKVYGTTVGVFFEGRIGVGYAPTEVVGGVQLDASFLAFPFLLVASATK